MSELVVYTREGCHLCVEAIADLRGLQAELGFALRECDIDRDEALQRAYFERIPVDETLLRERLESRK
jgi:glutaredoxin